MTPPEETQTTASTLRRAYLTVERLQRQLDEYRRARSEPIAIVGIGCRFPGGVVDTDSYWRLLSEGTDAVTEVPRDRWDPDAFYDKEPRRPGRLITRWGGFLDRIDRFDHDFFGISRREAVAMDPQQRLALEVTWEALENAGVAPASLAGSRTGVFMGVCNSDYSTQLFQHPMEISAYASTGSAHSILTGRISYTLDLRGPSLAVDTACSSSLVAVHQACQSLRTGECDTALSGGVNAVITPQTSISFSQFPDMLADDGRCKTFDASANGFVRSEGCGVVVLKRLSDAVAAGDRVIAVIRGAAVNQDGYSSGITAPNGAAQRDVLRRALEASGVEPEAVSYVEAHGTGTKLGDPIEVEALAEVYGRPEGHPVYLGSSKSNIGHTEAAAGIAGLIKIAACLEHDALPPNVHFRNLNPHISLDGTTFEVLTERKDWPRPDGRRVAGLSSFGFSGTNVHMIIEEPPAAPPAEEDARRPRSVLALSARSERALLKLAQRHQKRFADADRPGSAADLCHSANTGRSHFPHRLAAVGATRQEIAARLGDFVRGETAEGLAAGEATGSEVVFLFTGQGPQRVGMARGLYETQPAFRRTIDACDEILRPVLEVPLLSVLYPKDPDLDLINEMAYSQPVLFAVEYALAELWRSWGVEPAAVLGHSLGEYAAACFAGAMSLEDGLRLVAERGRLLQTLADSGAMAAVFAPAEEVAEAIAAHGSPSLAVAAVNGLSNTAISGDREAVTAVCDAFAGRGVQAKVLHISTSSHSPLVEPILGPLRELVDRVEFSPPRIPVVSNLTGDLWPWDRAPDADYWCAHARQAVLFSKGVATLHEMGYRTFLEVGPAPTLLGLIGDSLPPGSETLLLPSLRPKQDDWEVLLSTAGELYTSGVDLDWAAFDAEYARTRVPMPTYPFDQVRCWHKSKYAGAPFSWDGSTPLPEAEEEPAEEAGPTGGPRSRGGRSRGRRSHLPTADSLAGLTTAERLDRLTEGLLLSVKAVLRSKTPVSADRPLFGLGLDSLMAVELRNEIQGQLGVSLPVAGLLKGATVTSVVEQVAGLLDGAAPADGAPTEEEDTAIRRVDRFEDLASELLAEIDGMSDGPGPTAPGGEDQR